MYVIFSWFSNERIIPEALRINCSYCVHISFTVHFALAFALHLCSVFAQRSPFICAHQIPFNVRTPFAQSALIVRSECALRSISV